MIVPTSNTTVVLVDDDDAADKLRQAENNGDNGLFGQGHDVYI